MSEAPLLRVFAAEDPPNRRWLLMVLTHHLVLDHTTLELLVEETELIESGRDDELRAPVPFRNFVAQARLGVSRKEHQAFFKEMLGDIDGPTAPFGQLDVNGDGDSVGEASTLLAPSLSAALRERARRLGVSAASLVHLAWALVVARASGQEEVVFGTVVFGRMQGGASSDRSLGMFINTLPVRISVGGRQVEESARNTQRLLAQLIRHEHAPLALAQGCSGVPAQVPLFSALLNYRHSRDSDVGPRQGDGEEMEVLSSEERTNYPVVISVDDLGDDFMLTAQATKPIAPERICEFMQTALRNLVKTLEEAPQTALRRVEVMPAAEREQVLLDWNATAADFPADRCLHELIEEQAAKAPEAVAVVCGEESLSYGELNARANRLHAICVVSASGPKYGWGSVSSAVCR